MSWIKRNLYFLVGSVVAVALLAVAVVYLLGTSAKDTEVKEKLSKSYEDLKKLKDMDPSPGTPKVDNITNAQAQVAVLNKYIKEAQTTFVPVDSIPAGGRVDAQEFSSSLTAALNALRAQAKAADADGVTLPSTNPPYNFTFESIVRQVTFKDAKQLSLLARQLGEVKAIAEILFEAKIEALESFKRVRVAYEDHAAAATNPNDYLSESPKTNDWGVLIPYEVTIRCFSAQLAGVLAGFANSKHCFVVTAVNLEPAPQADAGGYGIDATGFTPMMPQPVYGMPYPAPKAGAADPVAARMRSRYGLGGGRGAAPGGRGEGRFAAPPPPQPVPVPQYAPAYPGQPAPVIPQEVLFERPVRVTLKIALVQLRSSGAPIAAAPGGRGRGPAGN
jgi:hypothetical protein